MFAIRAFLTRVVQLIALFSMSYRGISNSGWNKRAFSSIGSTLDGGMTVPLAGGLYRLSCRAGGKYSWDGKREGGAFAEFGSQGESAAERAGELAWLRSRKIGDPSGHS